MDGDNRSAGGLFDDWPDRYEAWFTTPVGKLIRRYEAEILLDMLSPERGELILDVGCGTGIFTGDILQRGARVVGMDISLPMLLCSMRKTIGMPFVSISGDMNDLPFPDETFDRTYSMTAVEFVADAGKAVSELNRVTRKGGTVVLTTLNRLSPWAERRKKEGEAGHSLFGSMTFRSPEEMAALAPSKPALKTAIHFLKQEKVEKIPEIEEEGRLKQKQTGAFLAMSWQKK